MISGHKPTEVGKRERLRQRLIPLLILLLVLAVSVVLFFYGRNPEIIVELKGYGYLGAFLISLIGNATVLLPGIVLPILSGLGVVLYPTVGLVSPVMIGLAGGVGAAIGEIVGYMAGYSGRRIAGRVKLYNRMEEWLRRWGALAIFILSMVPFIFDLVGIAAGVLRFPLWKFILLCWLGRTIMYVNIVVVVVLGWEAILPW